MSQNFLKAIEGLDLDQIELEDQGFFEEGYEVEIFWDIFSWNDAGTARTSDITWQGSSINPFDSLDENGNLDTQKWITEIRRMIQKGLDDEDRIGPIYVCA